MTTCARPWEEMETEWWAHHRFSYTHTDLLSLLLEADQRMQTFLRTYPEEAAVLHGCAPAVARGSDAGESSATPRRRPRSHGDARHSPTTEKGRVNAAPDADKGDLHEAAEEDGDADAGGPGTTPRSSVWPTPMAEEVADTQNTPYYEELFDGLVKIQAPMVRCSRPPFRRVCRLWGTDINYSHMIIADSFVSGPAPRHAEFALYTGEDRLVVQLAAKDGPTAARAALLLAPYCDGFDLNCGCPQRWAMREGLGSALLERPEAVADVVRSIRGALSGEHAGVPCVVKMRVLDDVRRSVEFARQVAAAGAGWVTVHGRTPSDAPSARVRTEAIRLIGDALRVDRVPVVANGSVVSPSTAVTTAVASGVGAVMAGNGLLDNPAAFYLPRSGQAMLNELTFLPAPSVPGGLPWLPPSPEAAVAYRLHQRVSLLSSCRPGLSAGAAGYRPLWGLPTTPLEVISDYLRAAIAMDLPHVTTTQQVVRMARAHLSPTERVRLSYLRSNAAILDYCSELGLYTPRGRVLLPETSSAPR